MKTYLNRDLNMNKSDIFSIDSLLFEGLTSGLFSLGFSIQGKDPFERKSASGLCSCCGTNHHEEEGCGSHCMFASSSMVSIPPQKISEKPVNSAIVTFLGRWQ